MHFHPKRLEVTRNLRHYIEALLGSAVGGGCVDRRGRAWLRRWTLSADDDRCFGRLEFGAFAPQDNAGLDRQRAPRFGHNALALRNGIKHLPRDTHLRVTCERAEGPLHLLDVLLRRTDRTQRDGLPRRDDNIRSINVFTSFADDHYPNRGPRNLERTDPMPLARRWKQLWLEPRPARARPNHDRSRIRIRWQ